MNQAYFTFCCSGTGKSLSGLGGDRVRAAVNGASETGLALYKQYCNYPQYSHNTRNEQSQETALKSLSFAKLVFGKAETETGVQRFLAHSVYTQPDKETLREGNYFSHLIYPVPNSWTVRTALQMWESPFWVTQDSDDIAPELPAIDENAIPFGIINEKSFVEFLRSAPERQEKFSFLLNSLLTLKPNDKIVLTGLPEEAAFCLWGATRCLPLPMWNNITFSTHEKPTLSFSFDIVNFPMSSTSENQEDYIFSELSRRPNIHFYSNSPQISTSERSVLPIVNDILEISINDEIHLLDEFYQTVPAAQKNSEIALRLFWIFANHPEQISLHDLGMAIDIPELKNQAIEMIMDSSRFSLDEQLELFNRLDVQRQDALLNRLISENSIEQIRSNERYSNLLVSALKTQEKPTTPEKDLSLLQQTLQNIINFIRKLLFR
ncbi:MAG: hypothetical protein IJF84_12015 [Thermoguttaceae bacterium]|nr:hypothetical protein [Thermoguttaceae bacterium]